MPYLDKAETWLEKSSQLLEARPSTVRPLYLPLLSTVPLSLS